MSDLKDFKELVAQGVSQLATTQFGQLPKQASADLQSYLDASRDDLSRWIDLLAQGRITQRDLSDLVHANVELADMVMLTQAGVALTRLERFRAGLIEIIINSAIKVALG